MTKGDTNAFFQMVDKLVVHIEDMATELTQKSDMELQEKISKARGLIDDANNSKKVSYIWYDPRYHRRSKVLLLAVLIECLS